MWGALATRVNKNEQNRKSENASGEDSVGADRDEGQSTNQSTSSGSGGGSGWGSGFISSLAAVLSEDAYTPEQAEQHRQEARVAAKSTSSTSLSSQAAPQSQALHVSTIAIDSGAIVSVGSTGSDKAVLARELATVRKQLAEQRKADSKRERDHADELVVMRRDATALAREHAAREATLQAELGEMRAEMTRKLVEAEALHADALETAVQEALTSAAVGTAVVAAANADASAGSTVAGSPVEDGVGTDGSGHSNDNVCRLEKELANLQAQLTDKTATLAKAKRGIVQLKADVQRSAQALESTQAELRESNIVRTALQESLDLKAEVLAERERALHAASSQLAESQALQDAYAELEEQLLLQRQLSEEQENIAKNAVAAATAATEAGDGVAEEIALLQEKVAEQAVRLTAFETEGQVLAKKQGEMERLVRTTKAAHKALEKELSDLKISHDAQEVVIADLRSCLQQQDSSASNTTKSMQALQASSKAAADKTQRLQEDVDNRTRELATARDAMLASEQEVVVLQDRLQESAQECAALKKLMDDTQNEALETDAQRRSVESREGMLRATNAQLQESLQRLMTETSSREERLRDELQDMRRRWQEALSSREAIAAEVAGANTPLLRQMSQLQETLRTRSEAWQTSEIVLSERALRAESSKEVADHKLTVAMESVQVAQMQALSLRSKLEGAQQEIQDLQKEHARLVASEKAAQVAYREAQAQVALEVAQLRGLQQSVKNMESQHVMTLSNIDETHSHAMESCTVELTRLRMRVQELEIAADANAEHKAEQGNWGATSTPQKKLASPPQSVRVASPPAKSPTRSGTMSTSTSDSIFSPYPEDTSLPSGGAVVGNLGETFAAHMRSSQVQQQKSDELASHLIRITQLERARTALLDEVTMLSVRNAKLEDDCIGLPGLQAALVQARSQADVLLQLVGEKEEELEAAQADMREIKALYRGQLDALLEVSLAQQTQPDANV